MGLFFLCARKTWTIIERKGVECAPFIFLERGWFYLGVTENKYQASLIKKIRNKHPDAIVLKTDSSYMQGIPDLLLLLNDHWAALEVKKDPRASFRPNQEYWINTMNHMSFASDINPTNEEMVLYELERFFES